MPLAFSLFNATSNWEIKSGFSFLTVNSLFVVGLKATLCSLLTGLLGVATHAANLWVASDAAEEKL